MERKKKIEKTSTHRAHKRSFEKMRNRKRDRMVRDRRGRDE